MKRIGLYFAIASVPTSLFGGWSIDLGPNEMSSVTVPNSAPYNALTSYRFEGRISNWSPPSSGYNYFLASAAGALSIDSNGNLWCGSNADSTTKAAEISIGGYSDFVFRCQRDVPNARMTLEVWTSAGKQYEINQQPTATNPQPVSWSGGLNLGSYNGAPGSVLNIAYLRWYSTALPLNSSPPTNGSSTGNLADWEFEQNATDSSGHVPPFSSWTGATPSYTTTPVYPPAANLNAPALTGRTGQTITLDGSSSFSFADNPSLQFSWQQTQFVPYLNTSTSGALSGADAAAFGTAQWSSQTASIVSAVLPIAGTYYFRLTVTDANGQSSSQAFKVGSVPTDSNYVVIMPDPKMSFLTGPLTMWGTSPWPWYDSVMKADADALFGPNGEPSTPPFQATASGNAGTVAVTNVQSSGAWLTVTGTGTHFTTDFACNGTDSIVIYYQLQNGQTGARPYSVVSCPDDAHMIINQWNAGAGSGYDASGPQTGVSYGKVNGSQVFGWTSSTTNWDYYDDVLALYRLYFRTGIDTYLNYARQLADNWYIFPLDGGRAYNNGSYQPQGARSAGALGMMARALDGHPERWIDSAAAGAPASGSGIKGMVDGLYGLFIHAYFSPPYDSADMVDGRETGYASWYLAAYEYLYDPTYYTELESAVLGSNSIASRYHSGYGFTTNANPFSASGGLTGFGYSGPNYQGSIWANAFILKALIAFIQASPVPSDQSAATALLQNAFDDYMSNHYMSGTCQEMTYSSAYVSCDSGNMPSNPVNGLPPGTVAATNGSNAITGSGTNFSNTAIFHNDGTDFIGINVGTGYQLLNIPAGQITSATSLTTATSFGSTSGSGLAFGRAAACPSGIGMPGLPQTTFSTLDANIGACDSPPHYGMGGRAVAELIHQLNGFLYFTTGDSKYQTQGDALFAAAYGCGTPTLGCLSGGTGLASGITGGGPGADGGAGNFGDVLVYQIDSQLARGKEFGSNAGAGMADTYLAYRLGAAQGPSLVTVRIGFDLAAASGANQVQVTVVQPNTLVARTVCSSSPCAVTVDARQGNHMVKLDYQLATGAVVAPGKPVVLKVR